MNKSTLTASEQQRLIETATQALKSAYAPYSQFRVGAAVLTTTGKIFAGCNIENASYGLSMCAERNAIANAIIAEGKNTMEIKAIAVTNSKQVSCSPCGACRQVIWEFGREAEVIFWGNQQSNSADSDEESSPSLGWQNLAIAKLLPEGFSL